MEDSPPSMKSAWNVFKGNCGCGFEERRNKYLWRGICWEVLSRQTIRGSGSLQSWTASTAQRPLGEVSPALNACPILPFPKKSPCGKCSCIPSWWPILERRDWTGWTLGLSQGTSVGQSDATLGRELPSSQGLVSIFAGIRGWKGSRLVDFGSGAL